MNIIIIIIIIISDGLGRNAGGAALASAKWN
jgi:hypothetical protein